jgi:hypothetical protein
MTAYRERYPPPRMSACVHDLLTAYIQLNLLIRRLVGKGMEPGLHERRDALLLRLIDAKQMLERSVVWN